MNKTVQNIISLLLTALLLVSACACITAAEEADTGSNEGSGKTLAGTVDVIMTAGTTQAFASDPVPEEDIRTILLAGIAAESAINQQPWFFVAVTDKQVMAEISGMGGMSDAGNASSGGSMPDSGNASSSGSMPDAPQGGTVPGQDNTSSSGTMPDAPQGETAPGGDNASSSGSMPDAPQGETEPKDQNGGTAGQKGGSGTKASLGDSPLAIIIYKNGKTSSPNPDFDCGLAVQNMYLAAASLGYGVKIVSSPTSALNGASHDQICAKLGVDPSLTAVAVLLIGKPDTAVDGVSGATTRAGLEEKANIVG